ncbi:hypothetical protein GWO43_26740, partial [candidate division KSB1 bacterium]|nr:hypothetical protein [candidate division Zixibacteria bacterium]NIT74399.1 hypothetical protein [candidate division KSB1 bacterium]NIW49232.1 hypothetical protein [Gammaproteobacteria bacterium]NIS48541.1 hypothetical protein [candidate division Zixibacteria bacterium]NIU16629.1 hypothetical protein [candidate division Zixibacteria bacterium]
MKNSITLYWVLILFFFPLIGKAEAEAFLSADSLTKYHTIWLVKPWKYHPGDNPQWAQPDYDDSQWQRADTRYKPNQTAVEGWPGIG